MQLPRIMQFRFIYFFQPEGFSLLLLFWVVICSQMDQNWGTFLGHKSSFVFAKQPCSCITHTWLVCISWLPAILNGKEQSTGQWEGFFVLFCFKKKKKKGKNQSILLIHVLSHEAIISKARHASYVTVTSSVLLYLLHEQFSHGGEAGYSQEHSYSLKIIRIF